MDEQVASDEPVTADSEVFARVTHRFELLDERVDTIEQVMANLMVGYMEMAAAVESLLADTFAKMDSKEQATFARETLKQRQEFLSLLQRVGKDFDFSATGPIAEAMERVADDGDV